MAVAPSTGVADVSSGTAPVTDAAWHAASDWAMQRICADRGYGAESGMCTHTQQSCAAGPGKSSDPAKYGEWVTNADGRNGRCASMDRTFAQWCNSQGLTVAPSPTGVHACVTNPSYCSKKGVSWSGGDCRVPPGQWLAEAVLGTTITRGLRWVGENPQRAAEEGARLTADGVEYVVVDSIYRPVVDPILRGDIGAVPGNVVGVTAAYADRAMRIASGTGDVAGKAVAGTGTAVTGVTAGAADQLLGKKAGDLVRAAGPGQTLTKVGNSLSKISRRTPGKVGAVVSRTVKGALSLF